MDQAIRNIDEIFSATSTCPSQGDRLPRWSNPGKPAQLDDQNEVLKFLG